MPLTLLAPAKINLFLHITGRRTDGYHTLQTVFQLLDIGDELEFSAAEKLSLESNYNEVAPQDNLIIKAAKLLQQATNCTQGAHIKLKKVLPSGAGLGGGSSDAATTLLALNKLWELGLSTDQLAAIGVQLGADVPVFVRGKNAWAEGIGEILKPVAIPNKIYLLVYPDISVPTSLVFNDKNLTRDTSAITLAAFLEGAGHNDCVAVVRQAFPAVDKALISLKKHGEFKMTGTGSCLFAEMVSESAAESVQQSLPTHWQSFVAKGVELSPTYQQLGLS